MATVILFSAGILVGLLIMSILDWLLEKLW